VKILTPLCKVTVRGKHVLSVVLQGLILISWAVFCGDGFGSPLGNLELRASAPSSPERLNVASGFTTWLFALSCLLLVAVFVVSLWPRKSDSNLLQRQRKFLRIDGLFLGLQGRILTETEQSELDALDKSEALKWANAEILESEKLHKVTLLSLSLGGVSLAMRPHVEKGDYLLLKLSALPDFPSSDCAAVVRVVWAHANGETGEPFDVCGAKLFVWDEANTSEALSQYVHFLMDEPAA
jgi:hypothetical protein